MLQVGDTSKSVTLQSQHERSCTLLEDAIWIVAWDKATTRLANEYFQKHSMKQNEQLLIDVSQVPTGILNLFVLPRMRSYKHEILLAHDEIYNRTLPYKENAITLLSIKKGKVEKIDFAEDEEELQALLR